MYIANKDKLLMEQKQWQTGKSTNSHTDKKKINIQIDTKIEKKGNILLYSQFSEQSFIVKLSVHVIKKNITSVNEWMSG